jgi:tol-pal system protein YbgF
MTRRIRPKVLPAPALVVVGLLLAASLPASGADDPRGQGTPRGTVAGYLAALGDHGLPLRFERLGTLDTETGPVETLLPRVPAADGTQMWKVAAASVAQIPLLHAEATPGVSSMAPGAATISGSRAMPFADPRPGTESTPRDLYQAAYLDFSRGNYALAIGGFREFVRRHPDDEVADNAQYWIGEAYLSLAHRYQDAGEWQRTDQALREAAQSFHEVAERYPIADKVPAALYKEALVLLELQQPAPARDRLEYLIDRFPGTPEVRLARQRVAEPGER